VRGRNHPPETNPLREAYQKIRGRPDWIHEGLSKKHERKKKPKRVHNPYKQGERNTKRDIKGLEERGVPRRQGVGVLVSLWFGWVHRERGTGTFLSKILQKSKVVLPNPSKKEVGRKSLSFRGSRRRGGAETLGWGSLGIIFLGWV